ncbi:MAG: heme ABC exporter ATP-binding protein CcmA [Alphaproteobacteria bacterium]|nr:heme ABC exporter ATP-binding protein CcmA [Alphaproteobacteria bacterium]
MLEAHNLACIRGGRSVFQGIEFSLGVGEVLSLQGPNGSGKSSLIRLLAGFLKPVLGEIRWAGVDIRANLAEHRTRLHYVGHADGIKALLSVKENLAFTCALNGAANGALDRALESFDLEGLADTPGRFLSSGQRRRLSLARLIAGDRPIWLLDEPGVGLDAASRERLERAIDRQREQGGITVLATHGDVRVANARVLEFKG